MVGGTHRIMDKEIIIGFMFVVGLFMIADVLYSYGFAWHNVDLGYNAAVITRTYTGKDIRELGLVDYAIQYHGGKVNKTQMDYVDLYIDGMARMKNLLIEGIVGGLLVGITLTYFVLRKDE